MRCFKKQVYYIYSLGAAAQVMALVKVRGQLMGVSAPSTIQVPGIELKPSSLAISTFIHRATYQACGTISGQMNPFTINHPFKKMDTRKPTDHLCSLCHYPAIIQPSECTDSTQHTGARRKTYDWKPIIMSFTGQNYFSYLFPKQKSKVA